MLVQVRQTEGVGSDDLDERDNRGQERVQTHLDPSQDGGISVRVLNPAMGVPISFLDKYCPEQFEIMGNSAELAQSFYVDGKKKSSRFYVQGKRLYDRIAIRYVLASK